MIIYPAEKVRKEFRSAPHSRAYKSKKFAEARAKRIARLEARKVLLKLEECEVCGDPKAERHHEDYNQPLNVKWLCRKCHMALHIGVEG